MSLLTNEEKIECLKNLLSDPNDWISLRLLELSDEDDDSPEVLNGPVGINEWSPEAHKSSSKHK
jgi:hypothetical protein